MDNKLYLCGVNKRQTALKSTIMDNEKILQYVKQYAQEHGFDSWRIAGERKGWTYYHFYNKATLGHYLGLGCYVKFHGDGSSIEITLDDELEWADGQEVLLNHLGNRT